MKCFFEYIRSSLASDQMYRVRPYVCRAFGVLYTMLMLLLAGVLYRILSVYIPEKTDRTGIKVKPEMTKPNHKQVRL